MFCPQCGTSQSDELKFCKSCGGNLFAVRQAVTTREPAEKFDWSKTWVADMLLSGAEREKRDEELKRQRGITPEYQSHKEIKAGVITTSVGIAVAIFLSIFMDGIIIGAHIPADTAEILNRLWIVGVIPTFVGLGLLINGLLVKGPKRAAERAAFEKESQRQSLPPANTSEFAPSASSVTEHTTRQLMDSDAQKR
jgi:hypothetical protein